MAPFSAAYKTEAAKRTFSFNYYVEFQGVTTKYSKKPVSGLTTKRSIKSAAWNPPRLSQDSTSLSVGTLSVSFIDKDGTMLADLGATDVHRKTLSLFLGYEALASGDYHKVAAYRIVEIEMGDEQFTVKAEDNVGKLRAPIRLKSSVLSADLTAIATTVSLTDASGFSTSGTGRVGNEVFTWTGKSSNDLTGVTRGVDGSDAETHDSGEDVVQVVTIQQNPITAMLQLLISPGGGGPYDVLAVGLGIPQGEIDVARFETVRADSALTDDTYKFELDDHLADALAFFEKEVLLFTGTRFYVDDDALLSLALLDEVIIEDLGEELAKVDVEVVPAPESDARRLVNRIFTKWDYGLGRDEFQKDETHNDTVSQAAFGTHIGTTFTSKGIRASLDGQTIINRFRDRMFRRVSFPIYRLSSLKCLSKRQFFVPGQKVKFTHDKIIDLPRATKGFDRTIEILSKKWDLDRGTVVYEVNASELLSERWGYIAPASDIASGTSGTVFTLATGEGVKWKVGWEVAVWVKTGGTGPLATSTITVIAGDVITVSPTLGFTPTSSHRLRFADYNSIVETEDDQFFFGFIGKTLGGNFDDARGPYLISG